MIPYLQFDLPSRGYTKPPLFLCASRPDPGLAPNEKISIEVDWSKGKGSSVSKPILASGIDIYLHGLQMDLDFSLPVGFDVYLLITLLERNEQFSVAGTVAWSGTVDGSPQYRMGIAFNAIIKGDVNRWNNLFPS